MEIDCFILNCKIVFFNSTSYLQDEFNYKLNKKIISFKLGKETVSFIFGVNNVYVNRVRTATKC